MTPLRWLILFFWIFVAAMLIKGFMDSESHRKQEAIEHPKQEHFFFTPLPGQPAPVAPNPNADVRQVGFGVQPETPPGSFTCVVTVKNLGSKKAANIQEKVRPYRGSTVGNMETGHTGFHHIDENDPLSQLNSWVTFPDLAPGESSTQSVTFLNQFNVNPGKNPQPEINFDADKTVP
jgi:hypothetical protein